MHSVVCVCVCVDSSYTVYSRYVEPELYGSIHLTQPTQPNPSQTQTQPNPTQTQTNPTQTNHSFRNQFNIFTGTNNRSNDPVIIGESSTLRISTHKPVAKAALVINQLMYITSVNLGHPNSVAYQRSRNVKCWFQFQLSKTSVFSVHGWSVGRTVDEAKSAPTVVHETFVNNGIIFISSGPGFFASTVVS